MFPKTTYPDEMRALLLTASEGNALPLWQAVPLTAALAALPAGTLRDYFPLPQPPEEQLRRTASPEETGAVYRLCALLVRLLSGKEMPERTGPSDRRAVLRTLAAEACPAGEEALFRLLDRGLRLEPTRRFPDRDALLSALREAEEEVNARVRPGLCLRGTAGVFAGKTLSLAPPLTLGRQPDLCQLIFPPDTRGVSRRHCRVELVWGTVLITDLHSRYGTAAGGAGLSPGCPSPLLPGQSLALAGGAQAFVLVHE
ncbi:FHA domain-containing protein [Dysosmobacter sp.]|uniref:FHA domain-containing protein n=1 Tax=Dysosmobacter sp. TaxID=2591382 RepID=UPI002AA02AD6|nr:FHA domain-containing protein [Dysosmobacter sp.]MDY5509328.1 FHA domain-containing protein [Dysosmobacter sp.]